MDEPQDQPAISDRVLIGGTLTLVTLSSDGRLQWSEDGKQRCLIVEREVLGFATEGSRISIRAVVDSGKGIYCWGSRGTLMRKRFVFEPLSEESKQLWCQKLQRHIVSLERPKRLFIFVNPFGGKKSASKIFLDDVQPLLEDADIEFTVHETKHQLHAKEIAHSLDLSSYDGIVCVSGDGILVEVINGLLEREDWETAIKMPLGIIPAGTGNGMIKSLLDSVGYPCMASNATLAVIRGHKRSLDVATISQEEIKYFSVLMLAWGLVADIDIESEKYRWMGSARLDFYGLQRMLFLRKYNGCISFIPAPGFEKFGNPCDKKDQVIYKLNICDPSQGDPFKCQRRGYMGPHNHLENMEWRTISGPFISIWLHNVPWGSEDSMAAPDAKDQVIDKLNICDLSQGDPFKCQRRGYMGPHNHLENMEWRTISGPFISIWLHNVPWGSEDSMAALDAKFSDGYLDLIIIRDCPKFALLSLMMELSSGNHVRSPHVMYLKVKAFALEPGTRTDDPTKGGIIDSDGEVLARGKGTYKFEQNALMAYDKLHIEVDQGLATLFSPI